MQTSFSLKADATSVTTSLNKKANLAGGNAFTGNQSFGGYNLTAIGALATTGNVTLGDSSADEHTINGDVRVTSGIVLTAGQDIRPSANATNAINIAQADGTDFVTFDTTNKRVGIGGVTPTTSLHVRKDLAWGAVEQLILENAASGGGAKFLFRGVNSHDQAAIASYDISGARGALGFLTTTVGWSGNPTEKVRIDPDGNVGIGTATPTSKLTVVGDTAVTSGALIHAQWAPLLTSVAVATSITATTNFTVFVVTQNVNVELPNPATIENGYTVRIKAIHASGCTICTYNDATTIDGAVTQTLAQWDARDCTYSSSNAAWYLFGK
jgi:hypothetical protein